MRKILFGIIALITINTQAYACLCFPDIMMGFTILEKIITQSVDAQKDSTKDLIKEVKKSQSALEEETKVITNLIALEKQLAVARTNLIFELNKKTKMMN